MPKRKNEPIRESLNHLFKLLARTQGIFKKKVTMLIELKESEKYLTKKSLTNLLNVNPNSITKWRKLYLTEGIEGLLKEKRGGKRRISITDFSANLLEKKLKKLNRSFKSFKAFHEWVESERILKAKYHTFYAFCKRNNIQVPK